MRRLHADEQALWERVVATVRPLHPATDAPSGQPAPDPLPPSPAKVRARAKSAPLPPSPKVLPGETLDGSWDRRLSRGSVQPDLVLDLHGHNLATAHSLLDERLEAAITSGARILLLVTGKPPGAGQAGKRGAIRAAIGDWLAASRHAGGIAAVRNAHPRHGGAGALYIILRRRGSALIRKRRG